MTSKLKATIGEGTTAEAVRSASTAGWPRTGLQAARDKRIAAQALRDAADYAPETLGVPDQWAWLRARADALAPQPEEG